MSKIYIVGHADGRRVYEHSKLPRFYVKSEPCNDPELRLFRTRSRKEAGQQALLDAVKAKIMEYWGGRYAQQE